MDIKIIYLSHQGDIAVMEVNEYFIKAVNVRFRGNIKGKENTYAYEKIGNILKKKLYFDENNQQYFSFKNHRYYLRDFKYAQGYFARVLVKNI